LLVLCEPTRGIDIGTKAEIQKKIRDLAESGLTILVVSSEIEEILAVSDRVIVMYEGVLRKELTGEELQKDTLVSAMYSADVGGSRGNASE
jgi:ABC-type sugar transport system ATPase subunit